MKWSQLGFTTVKSLCAGHCVNGRQNAQRREEGNQRPGKARIRAVSEADIRDTDVALEGGSGVQEGPTSWAYDL